LPLSEKGSLVFIKRNESTHHSEFGLFRKICINSN
jgi:hypothetical protein